MCKYNHSFLCFSLDGITGMVSQSTVREGESVCGCVWFNWQSLGFITQRIVKGTGSNPRAGGKKKISSPICKMGTWSCTGEQSTLAVSH